MSLPFVILQDIHNVEEHLNSLSATLEEEGYDASTDAIQDAIEELRDALTGEEGVKLPTTPEEGDYVLFPTGNLGTLTGVSVVGDARSALFRSTQEALGHVARQMAQHNFWPNLWWQSDHGNIWLIDKGGNEIRE